MTDTTRGASNHLDGVATPARPDEQASVPPDAGDIAKLWIDNGLGDALTAEHVHSIPIGKPRDFFRTHPASAYRARAETYVQKSENVIGEQFYLIAPSMRGRIDEARPCILLCVVDRTGAPRLWPIMQPRDGEKDNAAWSSARAIAREGLTRWVKPVWKGRAYMSRVADQGYAPDPDFGRLPPFNDLVKIAFGDHGIIRDETHPIYRDLFGRIEQSGGNDDPLL
jgi:hypothetical protein